MSERSIGEHDHVVLTAPVAKEGLEIGDVGTVVHVYAGGRAFEVEFTTPDGHTATVATVEASSVRSSDPSSYIRASRQPR